VAKTAILALCAIMLTLPGMAQQQPGNPPPSQPSSAQPASTQSSSIQPQVKVNVLNVCTPSAEEQKEIASALGRIPKQPLFSSDFEVSRGRSTLSDMPNFLQPGQSAQISSEPSVASYVRIRHEFSVQALFSRVQYSFSNDNHNMVETLVLYVRDPKELIQVALEDSSSSVTSPAVMLGANTPVNRIRLERFGKSSVALARCTSAEGGPAPDQSAYEPLFRAASDVLAAYRGLLGVRRTVPDELARVAGDAKLRGAKATEAPKSQMRRPTEEKK
jgi:hypothetical protein